MFDSVRNGPRRGDGVELVRVVQDGRLGSARRARVVVAGDGVEKLVGRVEIFEEAEPEVDVAEELSLPRRREDRRRAELACASDVMDERSGNQQIRAEPRVDLTELAAQRRHADRVLEQPARIRVVPVLSRGIRPQRRLGQRTHDDLAQTVVVHLRDEELEEAFELVGVAPKADRELGGIDSVRRLERPHLDLELVPELLHPPEHAHRVARFEAPVEEIDVVPDPRRNAAARVDELEREIRAAVARAKALLPRDRVDAFDGAVLLELGDRGHTRSFA